MGEVYVVFKKWSAAQLQRRAAARALALAMALGVLGWMGAAPAWAQNPQWGTVTPPANWMVSVTGDTTVTEGQNASYTVTLSEAQPYEDIRIQVSLIIGPASSGAGGIEPNTDYNAGGVQQDGDAMRMSGGRMLPWVTDGRTMVVDFFETESTHTFTLPITDDMMAELEGNENISVTIDSIGWPSLRASTGDTPGNSVLPTANSSADTVTTTISDIRTTGLVSIIGPVAAVDNGDAAVFTVRVDGTTTEAVEVSYSAGSSGDSATRVAMATDSGADYVSAATGTVMVMAGTDQTATISITTVDAESTEASEFFTLTITSATGGGSSFTPSLGATEASTRSARASIFGMPITITASVTSTPPAGLHLQNRSYPEGSTIEFTLTLTGPPPISDIFLPYELPARTAGPVDTQDFCFDSAETNCLDSLQQERHITLAEMAAARRMDNPVPITISLYIRRDNRADLINKRTGLRLDDSMRPPRGGGLGAITTVGISATHLRILDDEQRLLVEMRAMDVDEDGGSQEGFVFTLTRESTDGTMLIPQTYVPMTSGISTATVELQWAATGTATRGTDYTLSAGSGISRLQTTTSPFQASVNLIGTAGQPVRGVFLIAPSDDNAHSGDETIIVTLSAPSNAYSTCSAGIRCTPVVYRARNTITPAETDTHNFNPATLTIIDDEPQLSIAAPDPSSIAEGASAVFTVTLRNPPATGTVTVDWAIGTDSDAGTSDASGADFSGAVMGNLSFAQGASLTQQITLQTLVDGATESAEVFTVELSNAMGGAVGIAPEAASAAVTITANQAVARTLALAAGANSVSEGGDLSYTVTMTGSPPVSGNNVTVNWSVGADTDAATRNAAAGDFDDDDDGTVNTNLPSGTVTFTSSDVSGAEKTFTVSTAENTLSQADRTFVVTISATGGAGTNTVSPNSHTATLNDDDPMTASLTLSDDSLVEGTDTTAAFGVSLSGASSVVPGEAITATLEVVTADTTATGGAATMATRDYTTPASFSVTVAMNTTSASFNIALNNDNLNEGDETLALRLASVSGGNVSRSSTPSDLTKTATIAANDPTTVAVAGPNADVAEGGNAVFTFTFAGGAPSDTITLPYTVTGVVQEDLSGGASAMQNVFSISASEAAMASTTPVTRSLGIAADGVTEGAETLTLTLDDSAGPPARRPSGAGGGGLQFAAAAGSSTAMATIAANEPATLSVSAAAASVDEDATNAAVVFNFALRQGANARTVPAAATITYQLGGVAAGGLATDAARDYTLPTGYDSATQRGTATINAGSGAAMVSLPLHDDSLNESNEAITLTLIGISGGGGGSLSLPGSAGDSVRMASASIADDDDLTVSVSGPGSSVTEGASVSFSVMLSGGTSTAAVMVPWSVGADSDSMTMDVAEGDFDHDNNNAADTSFPSGTLTINAGQSSGTIMVQTFADGTQEDDEVFVLTLGTSPSSTTRGDAVSASATMNAAAATIGMNAAVSRAVNLSGPNMGGPNTLAEGATSGNYTVRVNGSAPTASITVNWAIGTDSDANTVDAAASDFSGATSGSLTFTTANYATDQTFTLTSVQNTMSQSDKVFTVTITVSGGGTGTTTVGTGTVTTTITDDDPLTAAISISNADLDENSDSSATFRISLSGGAGVTLGETTTITWAISSTSTATGGTASDAARDYTTPTALTTEIAMSNTMADFSIPLNNDNLNEGAETIVVSLSMANGANVSITNVADNAAATAIIAANDATTLSVAGPNAAVQEGGEAVFTLTLGGGAPSEDIVAAYTLSGVPASDLVGGNLSGEKRITLAEVASGDPITIGIGIAEDMRVEGARTLTLTLGTLSGGGGGGASIDSAMDAGTATANIAASDTATVVLSVAAASVAENAENAAVRFNLELRSGSDTLTLSEAASVSYTLSGTATGGAATAMNRDYTWPSGQTSTSGILTLDAETSGGSLSLPLNDDALNEAAETLIITLTSTTGGVDLAAGAMRTAQATITDNDAIALSLASAAGTDENDAAPGVQVNEGANAAFEVTLSSASAGPVTVAWSASVLSQANSGGAAGGPNSDQNPDLESSAAGITATADRLSGSVTIAAGSTTGRISFVIREDTLTEGDENVELSLGTVTPGAGAGEAMVSATESAVEFTIVRNSASRKSLVIQAPSSVNEGETVVVNVELRQETPNSHTRTVEVDYSVDGSATRVAAASGLGRTSPPALRDYSGAQSGTLSFPVGTSTRQISFPTQDDALNEGAETLRISLGAVREGGQPARLQDTAVEGTGENTTTLAASDPIMLSLVRSAGEPSVRTAGELPQGISYRVTFGCADGTSQAAGNCQPVVPSTQISIPYAITLGGMTSRATLTANPGQTADMLPPISITAQQLETALAAGTAEITVALDAPSTPALTPTVAPIGEPTPTVALLPMMERTETQPVSVTQTVGTWAVEMTLARTEAPEGRDFQLRAVLRGSQALPGALTVPWRVMLASGAGNADAADFGGNAPSGDFTFPAGTTGGSAAATQTASFRVSADDVDENIEGFSLALQTASGPVGSRTAVNTAPQQIQIPALRGTLALANVRGEEGSDAVFRLSFATLAGAMATTADITISYTLGAADDTATADVDYRRVGQSSVVIAPGATANAAIGEIRVALVADGQIEGDETFTLTLTEIRTTSGDFMFPGGAATLSATGTISDARDEARRRERRSATLVAVLDRAAAGLATELIGERIARSPEAAEAAALSLAGRNLTAIAGHNPAGAGAGGANAGDALGLALYGAAGRGNAGAADAFGGLGAGLAGGANMGRRTPLPNLAELMRGSQLNFSISSGELFAKLTEIFPNGISVWASGGFTNLMGSPQHGAIELNYRGDSLAAYAGADSYVRDNLLAGAALGYTSGDLNFSDRAGGYALSGELHNRKLSLHPYLGWRIRPNLQAWLVLGFGLGDVDVQETEGDAHRALNKGADSTMWMGAAGVDGSVQMGERSDLKLRMEIIRVQSRVDSGSFNDNTLFPQLRAVSSRAGSSVEVGRRFTLPNGMELRPFGLARLRMDRTHKDRTTAVDVGAGAQLNAPIQGITGRLSMGQQLNSANHEQRQFAALIEYDMGSDAQGLGISLQSTLESQRSIGMDLGGAGLVPGAGFGSTAVGFGRADLANSAADNRLQQTLRGELSYGVASRAFGAAALLTPYARFELRSQKRNYATGLRLRGGAGLELGLEAALATAPGATPDPQLLLRGALRF